MKPASMGDLELAALLAVARLGDEAYGAVIRRDLSERAARDYSVGAIYTTLQRLEDKGLVASSMSTPTAVRGGRARRCFRVTAAGARALRHEHTLAQSLWSGVPARLRAT